MCFATAQLSLDGTLELWLTFDCFLSGRQNLYELLGEFFFPVFESRRPSPTLLWITFPLRSIFLVR